MQVEQALKLIGFYNDGYEKLLSKEFAQSVEVRKGGVHVGFTVTEADDKPEKVLAKYAACKRAIDLHIAGVS